MSAPRQLHDRGQSRWLDSVTRENLGDGVPSRRISDPSATSFTSNPTIFDHVISNSDVHDGPMHGKRADGRSGEALFFELAIEDPARVVELFHPVHDLTGRWHEPVETPADAEEATTVHPLVRDAR